MSIIGANNTVSTYRLTTTNNQDEYSTSANLSGLGCYIEPVSPDVAVIFGDENAFKTYKCYIKGAKDIIITDKVIDKQYNEYIVQGVEKFENNTDVTNQTELTMVRKYPV